MVPKYQQRFPKCICPAVKGASSGQKEARYLIYDASTNGSDISVSNFKGLFRSALELDYNDTGNRGGALILASYKGSTVPKLKLRREGKRIGCSIAKTKRLIENAGVSEDADSE